MRRVLGFLFGVMRLAARPLARLDSLTMKLRAAPLWGSLVLGRSIHPTVRCNGPEFVKLGEQITISYHVVFEVGADRTGHSRQPLIEIADQSSIGANTVFCAHGAPIRVGENTHIHTSCHFGAYGKGIIIGRDCLIASHCSMVDTQHVFKNSDVPIIEQGFTSKGIVIKDDVWLGAGVILVDGVTVGQGAVIGAGSVVTKDIPPGAIAVGAPARVMRYRSDDMAEAPLEILECTPTRL